MDDIDIRARALFDAMPHRHPSGRAPDWDFQPEGVREVFRGFARTGRDPRIVHAPGSGR